MVLLSSGHWFTTLTFLGRQIMIERYWSDEPIKRLIFQVSYYKLGDLPEDHF